MVTHRTIWEVSNIPKKYHLAGEMWPILKCYALPGASHGWPMIGRSLDWKPFLDIFLFLDHFLSFFFFAGWLTTQFLFLMNISKFAPAKTMVIHPVFGWSTLSTPILHGDFSIKNPPHIDIWMVILCQIFFKWVWVNTYRYIFSGMNIHLPAILGFTRYQGFDPSPNPH